jgi:hypothetical protein
MEILPLSCLRRCPDDFYLAIQIISWPQLTLSSRTIISYRWLLAGRHLLETATRFWINFCWSRQHSQYWFRVPSGPINLFLFFPELLLVLKWDLLFDEMKCLNTTCHCASTGGDSSGSSVIPSLNFPFPRARARARTHTHTHTHTHTRTRTLRTPDCARNSL